MQVRKKILTEDDSREHCSPRLCRQSQNVAAISERKVSELIASTKKKKIAELHSRSDPKLGSDLDAVRDFLGDEADDISMSYQASLDHMSYGELVSQGTQKTVFSPPFVHPKFACGSISNKVDFKSAFINKDQAGHRDISIVDLRTTHLTYDNYDSVNKDTHMLLFESDVGKSCEDEFSGIGDLSPEVSAIYLAMQQSKLECIDEKSSHSICEDVCVEPEDDDFDDFDPYLFIKDLPDLSEVVPKYRSMLLPKQTRSCPSITLVLDLDETLVHSTLEPCKDADFAFPVNFNLKEHTIYVRCRPFLRNFMERVATLFETIIFTASQSIYAEQLLNMLDPRRKLFRHRVFRESCVFVEGNYLKDLSVLGRDLARVIIIDNSPQAFGFQLDNGIPIESWFDDASDCELLALLPFLEGLVGVEDVRPLIAKKFNLRQKVESAAHPIDFRR